MIKIGFPATGIHDSKYCRSIWEVSGKVVVSDKCIFGTGSRLCVSKNATLTFGRNFVNTGQMLICCGREVSFGDNVSTSWETVVMDIDWHKTINTNTNVVGEVTKPIHIGTNVWLCMRSVVLKGTRIADGCIVGASSVVKGNFEKENSLIAGNPGVVTKENIMVYR